MAMVSVPVTELTVKPFELMLKGMPLLTAGTEAKFNTMTISWGALGTAWAKPVCTCYVRPERYTHEFMESSEYFTLSYMGPEYKAQVDLCGSKSGRDIDKFKECGITAAVTEEGAVYVAEAELVLVCKKLYGSEFTKEGIKADWIIQERYPNGGYHTMYMGEVLQVLQKA